VIELHSRSPEDTRAIASGIAQLARAGDLIVLAGQMGTGKTAFAQGFARRLGIAEPVTSPTYTLIHSYQAGSTTLHHADLYRLEHTAEVDDLALRELLEDDAIVLVEWGDVVDLGPHLHVELRYVDADAPKGNVSEDPIKDGADRDAGEQSGFDEGIERRTILITTSDLRWGPRWERLEAAVDEWVAS
jgi:tRNA threonylcarbamoyladenosine biosynthesis protein TsaE